MCECVSHPRRDVCVSLHLFAPQMILFSACCICGLIGGILNFQFVRALTKRPDAMSSIHLAAMTMACLGKSPETLETLSLLNVAEASHSDYRFLPLISTFPRDYLLHLMHVADVPSGQL